MKNYSALFAAVFSKILYRYVTQLDDNFCRKSLNRAMFFAGPNLWACILLWMYPRVAIPATHMPSWQTKHYSSPVKTSTKNTEKSVVQVLMQNQCNSYFNDDSDLFIWIFQATTYMWQLNLWLYCHLKAWSAAITCSRMWIQPQKTCSLWTWLWISGS